MYEIKIYCMKEMKGENDSSGQVACGSNGDMR